MPSREPGYSRPIRIPCISRREGSPPHRAARRSSARRGRCRCLCGERARRARARCRRTSNESLSRSRAGRSFDIDATRLRAHLPIRIDARDALHRARRGQPLRARIAASIVARREPKPSSEHALNARRSPLGLNAASIELATFDAGFDACASVCERVRGEIMDDDSARDVPVCVANRAAR
ncbi:hypothetical protein G5C41_28870 [Burkholderia pseudomallei]|uniref:hypothetical protein n=1 Tax=Burkholderia TaxID=32008 RepID=UPI0013E99396|nr:MULTISPECIES: hypothetical protein [Burkholderia]MBD2938029.1 hypothetical protein [Burkholderia pseudomallei]MBD2965223.1 hypothetical protein [Burkholderia pseudomallei]MBF3495611.1 hypothetical protein [Burkholderia pseudomallei]MCS6598229.1 hypothetical protein [Burkholderia pseudomallei]MCT7346098.1 hypothetical protein [Burkholderia pseudomallei]